MEFWILPPVSHAGSPELPRSIAVITAACYAWFYIAKIPAKNLTLGNSEHHIADISANGRDDGLIIFVILIIIMCIKNKMCQLALNTAVFTCFHLSGTCTTCCLPVADTGIGRPGAPPPLTPPNFIWPHMCFDYLVQTVDQHELHLCSNSDRLIHLRSLKSSSSHSKSPSRVRKWHANIGL